jgi:putative membrane-bound dehydrogenase-like protein
MRPLPCLLTALACWLPLVGSAWAQGYSPEEAVQRMQVPAGFEVQLVAAEPLVRQPVCIEFDDRGRLWVIQYLQYPNPEGLKRTAVDRFSRTKYDRVPQPPPQGPRGADRITILEDSDGDGRMDHGRDFVSGLNLTSGMAFGHDGVFILNVPYLLFYPDKNRDDVPDGDPEVLLTGFGMEDAHSVANSLTFGPDGWLYGCQGSTVTAKIRGIEFQQGVWRYHPQTKEFELFCEGGGNSWGLDFDRAGNLLYSTNYGGHVLLHGVQGGYFIKSFAKHGALHNPHAYGYFDHAPHANFRGGHVTVGGIVYQADAFPESFRGKYIAGDLLGHGVYWHDIQPRGSTFQTAHGGELLVANDTWFAPTDVTIGPDGAIYVADWHDARTAHPDPDAEWDRSNGRIFRIAPKGHPRAAATDFAKLTADELLNLHAHPSQWYVRRARQELARRKGTSLLPALREQALVGRSEAESLEALWSLHVLGGFDESLAMTLLESPHPAVRAWTIRLLGDARGVSEKMAHRLDELAEQEPATAVRQQLASTAARLPAAQALPIINANINRDIDNADPYLPLLWWWSVERHSVSGREEVLRRFVRPTLWKSQLGRETLLTRLIRRYAAEGTSDGLDSVVKLLQAAPDDAARDALWQPILEGLREAPRGQVAQKHTLAATVLARWQLRKNDPNLTHLAILLGHQEPFTFALATAVDPAADAAQRVRLLGILAESPADSLVDPLLALAESDQPEAVRLAALSGLARADNERVAPALIALHGSTKSPTLQNAIRGVLLGRKVSARAWLLAVDRGEIAAERTPLEQVRQVALLEDIQLDALVTQHWGKLTAATREEKLAEVRRLNNDLRAALGNAASGKAVYQKHCAACHQLHGAGTKLGPDLTTANRADREFLLSSLVDPSGVIRKEYVSVVVRTTGGRVLTGLPVAREGGGLTLADAKNERTTLAAADIEELRESAVSLMPDDLYRQLSPSELRDLFAFLQAAQP